MITLQEALSSGSGEWRSFTCPSHDDGRPSARVNTSSGNWVCMVCGAKGHGDVRDIPEDSVAARIRALDAPPPVRVSESVMTASSQVHPYWLTRFSRSACLDMELGTDLYTGQPCYPIRSPWGRLLGITVRTNGRPKYRYPSGVPVSELLFGYHMVPSRSTVVLVEGAPDVVALREAGVPAVGAYGSRLSSHQVALLSALEPLRVLVAFDMDRAGEMGAERAIKDLLVGGLLAERISWEGWKDVAEMPVRDRQILFEQGVDTL